VGDSKNVASVWDPRSGERGNERKQATRFASSQSVTSVRQLVLFDLLQATASTERTCLALNVAQVQEITGPQSIASLPHAPTGVLGLIAWRGRAVPLLNLSATLGLPDHVAARLTRVVIVRRPLSDDHIAFVAPSAIRTQLLGKNQTTRRDDLCLDADRFFGAFTIGQETLLVPNLDQVFARGLSSIAV
jgi:chemotaxis signal transduction protein